MLSKEKRQLTSKIKIKIPSLRPLISSQEINDSDLFFLKFGRGSKIFDYNGKHWVDFYLADGSLILGHSHRNVILATKVTAERGTNLGTISRDEVLLAHEIIKQNPNMDSVCFFRSKFEAIYEVIRLSRKYTNRQKVIIFDANFSSSVYCDEETIVLPYDDVKSLQNISEITELAAIIVEPVATNKGLIHPHEAFLKKIHELCRQKKSIIILDAITTGFRQKNNFSSGDHPDLMILGNVLSAGYDFAALAGNQKIMDFYKTIQNSQLPLSPIVLKSGLATIRLFDNRFYKSLDEKARTIEAEVNNFCKNKNLPYEIKREGSLLSVINTEYKGCLKPEQYNSLVKKLFVAGFYFQPNYKRPFSVSNMHSKNDIHTFIQVFTKAIETL